mmetsp:Transcript_15508/g.60706  ORF Transcript_15508/g.60706 Transcript_15508/m.60706 type:complete len:227 (+) Transcript_15508:267-947(+)
MRARTCSTATGTRCSTSARSRRTTASTSPNLRSAPPTSRWRRESSRMPSLSPRSKRRAFPRAPSSWSPTSTARCANRLRISSTTPGSPPSSPCRAGTTAGGRCSPPAAGADLRRASGSAPARKRSSPGWTWTRTSRPRTRRTGARSRRNTARWAGSGTRPRRRSPSSRRRISDQPSRRRLRTLSRRSSWTRTGSRRRRRSGSTPTGARRRWTCSRRRRARRKSRRP